jgi:hypothetical protein
MGVSAGIAAGGAVIGGLINGNAAENAASTEAGAANNATAEEAAMFGTEQANEQPYMAAGSQALGELQGQMSTFNQPFTMSQFQEDPGYQFDLQQGQQAINNSAAASGHLISSQQLGNASNYADSMASNEFNNAYNRYQTTNQSNYNRLMGVSQLGQAGASNTNAAAMNTANAISANTIGAGNAAAAGTIGAANATSGAIGGVANSVSNYGLMSNLMPQNNSGLNASVYGTSEAAQGLNGSAGLSMPSMYPTGGGTSMSSLLSGE